MRINVTNNSTNTDKEKKFIFNLAVEVCKHYFIPQNQATYFIYEDTGREFFAQYMSSIGIPTTITKMQTDAQTIVALVFDIEETEALTMLLLKHNND